MSRMCFREQFAAEEYRKPLMVVHARVWNSSKYFVCPRCSVTLDREFAAFCDRCGQRLDWKYYKKATVIK